MDGADSEVFLVGDLRVDVGQQRVTRTGIEIALPNLSLQLLIALIRVAPNVLSHDLLMARVWPGLVVSPETVAKRVNLLREALGDDAQEPRYIAGVRSRGYQLVAAVSPAPHLATPEVTTQLSPIASHTITTKAGRMWWLALPILLVAILAIAIGMRMANRVPAADTKLRTDNPPHESSAIGARERTVAVLPFESISADPADAYLAQGLPEMILNRLSRISGISVIARNSSFALATKSIDSSEIGRRLNSGYLINGSVQRKADHLRVAVQLVDAVAGTQVWSAHFDRDLSDIFSVEDEIADQVADALSARLGGFEATPVHEERSSNIEAYLAYLRGRALLGRFTVTESEAAVPYFEKALALDPNFAAAYASLYDARMQAVDQRMEDLTLARRRYHPLIDRALELDPQLGAAYFARAMWGEVQHDAEATVDNPLVVALERDFSQGAALDPSNGRGLAAYAEFLYWTLERPEEGRSVLKRALWVDPLSASAHLKDAVLTLAESGIKASEQKNLQVLQLDPNFVPALQRYGMFRWRFDGKLVEAIQYIEHAIALDPNNSRLRQNAEALYLDLDDLTAARDVAAGTLPNVRTTALLSMHEGDWRRAGLAAYDEAGWTKDDDLCQNWLASEAIRDYAMKTGDLSRAIAFIKLKYYLDDAPAVQLDPCSFRAAVYLSQLMAAAGHGAQALALRRAASSWLDANATKYFTGAGRLHATILLLDGKQDAALTELADAFRSGSYADWWYTIKYDPLWVPLHGDPRFKAIAADVRRYVDAERSQLEVLRQHGDVPRRGAPTVPH
jgi:TolB-like protein/DNA-binding winged helix-turn-helix (wHTH) protein/Tfp pilus assembly protein PilF